MINPVSECFKNLLNKTNENKRQQSQHIKKMQSVFTEFRELRTDLEIKKFEETLANYSFSADDNLKPTDLVKQVFVRSVPVEDLSITSKEKGSSISPTMVSEISNFSNPMQNATTLNAPKNISQPKKKKKKKPSEEKLLNPSMEKDLLRLNKALDRVDASNLELKLINELQHFSLEDFNPSRKEIEQAKLSINRMLRQPTNLTFNEIVELIDRIKIIANSPLLVDTSFLSVKLESKRIHYLEKSSPLFYVFWNRTMVLMSERILETERRVTEFLSTMRK